MIQICTALAVLSLVLLFRCKFAQADGCLKGSKVVSRKFSAGIERDFKITGPVLSNVSAENQRECELACHLDFDCGMFNYYPSTKICELLYKDRSAEYRVERKNGSLFRAHNCFSNLCGHSSDPQYCHRLCTVLRSCCHAKSLGYNESRNYTINPDASGKATAFQVFCDMRDKDGVGVTVVSHNSENRTLVLGCEDPGCYRRDVLYNGISDVMAQLGALTKVSAHCEQYIKYECLNSGIISDDAWLVSRDGRRLNYWGGAPPNSGKCACGVAGNCTGGLIDKCNCDENSWEWLEDSGFLSYKDDLPITMLRFGDAGRKDSKQEKGYHTLGKLRCYGQI